MNFICDQSLIIISRSDHNFAYGTRVETPLDYIESGYNGPDNTIHDNKIPIQQYVILMHIKCCWNAEMWLKCERRPYPFQNEKERMAGITWKIVNMYHMYHKHHHTGYLSKYVNNFNQSIILLKYAGSCSVLNTSKCPHLIQ